MLQNKQICTFYLFKQINTFENYKKETIKYNILLNILLTLYREYLVIWLIFSVLNKYNL